ncbi:hypothetical protein NDU88_009267 [Pleurodeles waltl]|uniref:Uncharacterized protein n=1 Tax=Pleurodeles waltl TaxID=8319 RepID=A0AAV7QX31_PLEWA|nr:hypothetical protein NDU88_009267 [Pleurodeles waltl]
MASQRRGKKEGSLKDLSNKTPAKKTVSPETHVAGGEARDTSQVECREAPLTRTYFEQLFGSLREDFATLKLEIAAEVKDVRRAVTDLGQRVDTLERPMMHGRKKLTLTDGKSSPCKIRTKNFIIS